ncbi:Rap1a/Tai family immunity protein [Shewanella frigidimarina]|uniref:Rap1a/Tai family immunity protein n=1 Tax=Shewanella frigidimarina TaxID=56812 RepID=UPI003D78C3D5
MGKYLCLLSMLLALNVNAKQEFAVDGSFLLEHCGKYVSYLDSGDEKEISKNIFSISYCQGFIEATRQVSEQMQIFITDEKLKSCIPSSVRNDQLARVLVKSLRENPDWLHKSAGVNAWASFVNAYPCLD